MDVLCQLNLTSVFTADRALETAGQVRVNGLVDLLCDDQGC